MLIRLDGISKSYTSDIVRTHALRDVSLEIGAGEFVMVTGPSGCGKSTLMNVLGLLDFPDSGRIDAFGVTLKRHSERELTRLRRGNVGFIFQSFNLIDDLTVTDNIAMPLAYLGMGKPARRRRALELAEHVGLSARASHYPAQLSGGQQQRVAIARALAARPKLIVADEPTGNLDSANSAAIMALLRELTTQGSAVVVVTHDRELATLAERRISMKDGHIVDAAQ
ncbi:ABC transporter ATP-binding protein [Glycocaulis profundi]|nr:ABC transporter ATP-binding protein [Glycocaulis profundi]